MRCRTVPVFFTFLLCVPSPDGVTPITFRLNRLLSLFSCMERASQTRTAFPLVSDPPDRRTRGMHRDLPCARESDIHSEATTARKTVPHFVPTFDQKPLPWVADAGGVNRLRWRRESTAYETIAHQGGRSGDAARSWIANTSEVEGDLGVNVASCRRRRQFDSCHGAASCRVD